MLEIGGALSGLQFVLARAGCEVHNVDPFLDYGMGEYDVDPERVISQLNRHFGTEVMLHRSSLAESQVGGKFDAIFSVSTIEHMSEVTLTETLSRLKGLLAPGGRIVLTVDLFLNLKPFSMRETNQWGTNVSPKWIEDQLGMTLVEGDRSELYGYPEFSCQNILAHLEDYAIGSYPQLAQLMVFGEG